MWNVLYQAPKGSAVRVADKRTPPARFRMLASAG